MINTDWVPTAADAVWATHSGQPGRGEFCGDVVGGTRSPRRSAGCFGISRTTRTKGAGRRGRCARGSENRLSTTRTGKVELYNVSSDWELGPTAAGANWRSQRDCGRRWRSGA